MKDTKDSNCVFVIFEQNYVWELFCHGRAYLLMNAAVRFRKLCDRFESISDGIAELIPKIR